MLWVDHASRLPSRSATWADPAFEAEVRDWVSGEVGEVSRLEPVKRRVWATVWRAEADARHFYAKQNCVTQSFEAALVGTLAELDPHRVVPVTAVDADRGLLLTPDQGEVFGATEAEDDLDAWASVLAAGAALQRDLVGSVDRLHECGLTTIRPDDAADYVGQRVDELASLPGDDPLALAAEQASALRDHLPVVRRWSEQVAELGLPLTLNHNDLHEHNVFHVGDELRFFDFADSLLTEPLGALLIPLNILSSRLDASPDDSRLWRVVEPALEVWSDLAPPAAIRAVLPAALQLARLGRVESWLRCCVAMSDEERAEWGSSVSGWLNTLVLDPPLGRA